jgi:hypothetical protein
VSSPPPPESQVEIVPLRHGRILTTTVERDAWIPHLHSAVRITFGSQVRASGGHEPFFHHIYSLPDSPITSHLWLTPTPGDLLLFVAGPEDMPDSDVAAWANLVARADELLDAGYAPHRWAAVIGPDPDAYLSRPLDAPVSLGGLNLRPGKHSLMDRRPSRHPQLGAESLSWSWPIIVEGSTTGFDVDGAMRSATGPIFDLCLVLGVVWNAAFRLRDAPRPSPAGAYHLPRIALDEDAPAQPLVGRTAVVPVWASEALERVRTRPELNAAAGMFREAQLLERDHPSLALMGYVAVLDAIGAVLIGRKARNAARVRAALASVLSEPDVDAMLDQLQFNSKRHQSAHEGRLHGVERLLGLQYPPSFVGSDEVWDFSFRTLLGVNRTTARVVAQALGAPPEAWRHVTLGVAD